MLRSHYFLTMNLNVKNSLLTKIIWLSIMKYKKRHVKNFDNEIKSFKMMREYLHYYFFKFFHDHSRIIAII